MALAAHKDATERGLAGPAAFEQDADKQVEGAPDAASTQAKPMRVQPHDLLLYAVTDSAWLGERTLAACVAQAIAGGATFVQLREKDATTPERIELARAILPVCQAAGVPFVIDDDVECALAVGADGVHVGQDDMACARAREMLGPDSIVGVSAQTVEQALAAQAAGADYLGVGALIPTATKPDAADVAYEGLAAICQAVDIPVVGIGGLNEQTIPRFAGSGAAGAAVVSAIFAQDDCEAAARRLRVVCEKTFQPQDDERPGLLS